jgi:hypothetical protein
MKRTFRDPAVLSRTPFSSMTARAGSVPTETAGGKWIAGSRNNKAPAEESLDEIAPNRA